jgi:hypothetical protein
MKQQSAVTNGMVLLERMQQTQIKGLLGITMKIELVLFLILLSLNTVNKKPGLSVHSLVFTMVMGEVHVLSF